MTETENLQKIYVVVHNGDSEGYGAPKRAFASKRLAQIYALGAEEILGISVEIFELDLTDYPCTEPIQQTGPGNEGS